MLEGNYQLDGVWAAQAVFDTKALDLHPSRS